MNNFEVISRALSQNNAFMNKLNTETNNLKDKTNNLKTEITSKEDSFIILNTDALDLKTFNSNNNNKLEQNVLLDLFNVSSTAKLYSQFRDYDNKIFILKPSPTSTIIVDDITYKVTTCTPCMGIIINYDAPTLYLTFLINSSNSQIVLFNFYIFAVSDTEISATLSVENFNEKIKAKQDIISDIDTIRNNAANYKGTVTSVTVNGSSKTPSSGVVDIGNVATSVKVNGLSKTPSSGVVDIGNVATSVKVNGVSKTPSDGVVNIGYVNKQLITSTDSAMILSPNIYYRNTNTSLSTLTITLDNISNSNIINEYFIEFTTSSSGTAISLPSTIKWANSETPTFKASTTYQISIVNNLGVVITFK